MRLPRLSIRAAVLTAIVIGVVLPAALFVLLDHALVGSRPMALWLVVAQVLFGVFVLATVLSLRLLRPLEQLKQQAGAMDASGPVSRFDWPHDDELGRLGRHLGEVQAQNRRFVDELEAKNAELHRLAMHDQLTGLPNRRLLRELFEHEAAAARRERSTLALLFIDLDHFKAINDVHGHAVGDELLVAVAFQLGAVLRESDVVCRIGGDEFLVLLPHVQSWEQVAATVDRLLQRLAKPMLVTGVPGGLPIGASVGIALYPRDGADFDALARTADLAMYRSKDLGRGRYSFFQPALDADFRSRVELERELEEAIDQRQFRVYLQPVIDLADGHVVGREALLRWQHPTRGLLAPGAFLEAAERTGLIHALGRWMLEAGCTQVADARAAGSGPRRIAVNLSAMQLRDPSLPETLRGMMHRHAIEPGEIELEFTETGLQAESEDALATLTALREAGVLLVLDDFGHGASSLAYLKRLRPDKLKIDRSLVQGLPDDAEACALVQAILAMAQALGITVVAEGVEVPAQREWLRAAGCALQQGYLYARPAAVDARDPDSPAACPAPEPVTP